jgi:predicted transcriptional regulator
MRQLAINCKEPGFFGGNDFIKKKEDTTNAKCPACGERAYKEFFKSIDLKKNKIREIEQVRCLNCKQISKKILKEYKKELKIMPNLNLTKKEDPKKIINNNKISDEKIKEIQNYYNEGIPRAEIVKRTGLSNTTISKYIIKKVDNNDEIIKNNNFIFKEIVEALKKMTLKEFNELSEQKQIAIQCLIKKVKEDYNA